MKFYDKQHNRLIFILKKSTESFWTEKWLANDLKEAIEKKGNSIVSTFTQKYLPKGAVILEGGCGTGVQVYRLSKLGYEAVGVDFSKKTVDAVNALGYSFHIQYGDVEDLNFKNNHFDGYWSLGVIEHFWNGYNKIALEMFRVLKPKGYLFVTFPVMSSLRKFKAFMKIYPSFNRASIPPDFYQFALDYKKIISEFEEIGFRVVEKRFIDATKGLKDEVYPNSKAMQKIYYSNRFVCKAIRYTINSLFQRICGHTILLVFVKS